MDGVQIIVSALSGGLAGGCISTISNRMFRRRQLRTQFYPLLNDLLAAYMIRMERPGGEYRVVTVGYEPIPEDAEFVGRRSTFISRLVEFNELKEARVLREKILSNTGGPPVPDGTKIKLDLRPELNAVSACLTKIHKKLGFR